MVEKIELELWLNDVLFEVLIPEEVTTIVFDYDETETLYKIRCIGSIPFDVTEDDYGVHEDYIPRMFEFEVCRKDEIKQMDFVKMMDELFIQELDDNEIRMQSHIKQVLSGFDHRDVLWKAPKYHA